MQAWLEAKNLVGREAAAKLKWTDICREFFKDSATFSGDF
jgi:hypothetical protein